MGKTSPLSIVLPACPKAESRRLAVLAQHLTIVITEIWKFATVAFESFAKLSFLVIKR
jgi:hypothetical protein